MEAKNIAIFFLGLLIFLIGYWYLAKSTGETECAPPIKSYYSIWGWICIVLGIVLLCVGLYFTLQNSSNTSL